MSFTDRGFTKGGFTGGGGRSVLGHAMLAAAMAVLVCAAAQADPPSPNAGTPGGESAVWAPVDLSFVYRGFTTQYSCEGLRAKVKQVLIELGARDVEVRSHNCRQLVGPDPLPGVSIRMRVLRPAGAAGEPAVPARWKSVDLLANREPLDRSADCDLIAEIRAKVLPLFATRNVEYQAACEMHHLVIGSTRLRAEVLVADTAAAPAASAAR